MHSRGRGRIGRSPAAGTHAHTHISVYNNTQFKKVLSSQIISLPAFHPVAQFEASPPSHRCVSAGMQRLTSPDRCGNQADCHPSDVNM